MRGTNVVAGACVSYRNHANGRTLHETYCLDWTCAAGNDCIGFCQIGHCAPIGTGQHSDPGQGGSWPRPWSRTYGPRRTRSPLRLGKRPRSPPPSSLVSLRCLRLRHPLPARKANCSGANGSRLLGAAGSANSEGVQRSPISTAIRIKSEWFLAPSFCLSRDVVLATVL